MATKVKPESRETGWVITKVFDDDDLGEIGYGQLLAQAEETEASFNAVIGRTIFVSRKLKPEDIPATKRVNFRAFTDDGDPTFDGVVNVDWLMDEDDHAYNIDRYAMEAYGATVVLYNAADIKRCKPERADWVEKHPRMQRSDWLRTAGIMPAAWLPIYG